jgi:hypothetical protein
MTVPVTRIVRRERAIGKLHVHEFPTGAATILDEVGHTAWTTQPLTGAVLFSSRDDAEVALAMILSRTTAEEEVPSMSDDISRVGAERDALKAAAREFLTTLGAAMKTGKFDMSGSADMCHFVAQAMQKLDILAFDREEKRPVGLERLHEEAKP